MDIGFQAVYFLQSILTIHINIYHTGLWNGDLRFENLDFLSESSLILYVGGNIKGGDGKTLLDSYNSSIVIFEPVPGFFKQLEKIWEGYRQSRGFRAQLLNIGLGGSKR